MTLRIGFAYNERPSDEAEPPGSPSHDRYAEWDDPDTIAAVEAALKRAGDVIRLEADAEFPRRLRETSPDVVFNIAEGLDGPNREAHVPAICEFHGVAYTASDPLTLCLALDKRRAKEAFLARGVATPPFFVAGDGAGPLPPVDFPLPAFVKPLFEGSSKGIDSGSVCHSRDAVERRVLQLAERYDQPSLVEAFLPGREFTCGILGNGSAARVLPVVEIRFDALPAGAPPVYGWEAKWLWDTAASPLRIFDCPATLEPPLEAAIGAAALAAYHALGCRDWARVDVRLDAAGAPHVLEINPLPGILPDPDQNSCLPKAARAAGMSYDDLILACLDAGLARYGMRR